MALSKGKTDKLIPSYVDILSLIERAKLEWESVADSLPVIICLLNESGGVLRANKTLEEWKIGDFYQARGQNYHELLHPHCTNPQCYLRLLWDKARRKIRQQKTTELEIWDEFIDKHIQVTLRPIATTTTRDFGYDRFAVLIIHDITEVKRTKERLVESYKYIGSINRKLDILLKLNTAAKIRSKKPLYALIHHSALELSQSTISVLYLYDKTTGDYLMLSHEGMPKRKKDNFKTIPFKNKLLAGKFSVTRQPVSGLCSQLPTLSKHWNDTDSFVILPLSSGKRSDGLLLLIQKGRKQYDEEDFFMLELFSYKITSLLIDSDIIS